MSDDVRDYGALGDNADAVILLDREDGYHRDSPGGDADFIVAWPPPRATATIRVGRSW